MRENGQKRTSKKASSDNKLSLRNHSGYLHVAERRGGTMSSGCSSTRSSNPIRQIGTSSHARCSTGARAMWSSHGRRVVAVLLAKPRVRRRLRNSVTA